MKMARDEVAHIHWPIFILSVFVYAISSCSASNPDGNILLKFEKSLSNTSTLNWSNSTIPCNGSTVIWTGVLCNNGNVWGVELQDLGLTGLIDIDTLSELPYLSTIGFTNNSFEGPMPEVKKLGSLISFYLSDNKFSGEIPDDAFSGLGGTLRKLYLAGNGFTGKIPSSLVSLPKLTELDLGDNQLTGKVTDFQQTGLKTFNVANNQLEGAIPPNLSNFDASAFTGNKGLCGKPLSPCKEGSDDTASAFSLTALYQILIYVILVIILNFYRREKAYDDWPD